MKVKSKLIVSFGIILLVFLTNIVLSITFIRDSNKSITLIKNRTYKQLEYSNDINIAVIQVQQYLSDASLTRDPDSFKEADKYKELFKESLNKLQDVSPNIKDKMKKMDEDFDVYYDLGIKMSNTYINQGLENGNVLMKDFDPMAEKLSSEISELNLNSKSSMNSELDTIYNRMDQYMKISIISLIISIILAAVIIIVLGSRITFPINNMLKLLRNLEIGEGDLTKRINIKSKDEIADMGSSFNRFMDKLVTMVGNIKENSTIVSLSSEYLKEDSLRTIDGITKINDNMIRVENDNKSINDSVRNITKSVTDIAETSETAAREIQDICVMAGKINSMAIESGEFALNTKLEMDRIQGISSNTITINEKLGAKAKEIEKIIDTIKIITNETNLLALNAAIEAARAGEHGRGFGIVAEQIRNLAENSSQSAKMIEELIKDVHRMIKDTIQSASKVEVNISQGRSMVESVVIQLEKIVDSVKLINNKIQAITATSEEQTASTQELSITMEAINNSSTQITGAIEKIAESIKLQRDIALNFNTMASNLNSSSGELNNLVDKFIIE